MRVQSDFVNLITGLPVIFELNIVKIVVIDLQGGPKKAPCFVFHPKVVLQFFFTYFSGDVDSRPGRFS